MATLYGPALPPHIGKSRTPRVKTINIKAIVAAIPSDGNWYLLDEYDLMPQAAATTRAHYIRVSNFGVDAAARAGRIYVYKVTS